MLGNFVSVKQQQQQPPNNPPDNTSSAGLAGTAPTENGGRNPTTAAADEQQQQQKEATSNSNNAINTEVRMVSGLGFSGPSILEKNLYIKNINIFIINFQTNKKSATNW